MRTYDEDDDDDIPVYNIANKELSTNRRNLE